MDNIENPIIRFHDVSFFYTLEQDEEERALSKPEGVRQVFSNLNIDLPKGVVSLLGQNGVGKSTFLLLAGARIFPTAGKITLFDKDTEYYKGAPSSAEKEEERNAKVSFIYQNMEFETEEPTGLLMDYIYENGYWNKKDPAFLKEVKEVLELEKLLDKKTQQLSKGELQRTIIAFSLLYGSQVIMMDEPVFALEEPQKDKVFSYLLDFSKKTGTSIFYSAHNLDLTEKYSEYILLFSKEARVELGTTEDMFKRDKIEDAFKVPMSMLYKREQLFRETLLKESQIIRQGKQE